MSREYPPHHVTPRIPVMSRKSIRHVTSRASVISRNSMRNVTSRISVMSSKNMRKVKSRVSVTSRHEHPSYHVTIYAMSRQSYPSCQARICVMSRQEYPPCHVGVSVMSRESIMCCLQISTLRESQPPPPPSYVPLRKAHVNPMFPLTSTLCVRMPATKAHISTTTDHAASAVALETYGARGSVVVKALCYKPEGCGFRPD
jgi:hypothetical protein